MVILLSVVMLSALSTIGLSGVMSASTNIDISRNERIAVQGFYNAEGGIEHAKAYLSTINLDTALSTHSGDLFNGPITLAHGSYHVAVTDNDDGDGDTAADADNIIVATATGASGTGETSTLQVIVQKTPPGALTPPGAISVVGEGDTSIAASNNITVDGRDWTLTDTTNPTGPETDKYAIALSNIGAGASNQTAAAAMSDLDSDISSNQEANFVGIDNPSYDESIGVDDGMTSAEIQAFVDMAKTAANTTLMVADVPNNGVSGNTSGANNCLTVGANNVCLGSPANPMITYFNMKLAENGNVDRQVKFNGNIEGAGLLIVEGNDLLLKGRVSWTGMIITLGVNVGAGMMGGGGSNTQNMLGAFIVDDQGTDNGNELVLNGSVTAQYSSEAIELARTALLNNGVGPITQVSWRQL